MKFFSELKSEWKKITWPTGKEVAKKAGIVVIVCAILSAVIAVFDLVINWAIRGLEGIFLKK